jgi:hypothetical protein
MCEKKHFKYSTVHVQIFRYAGSSSALYCFLADTEAGSIWTAEEKDSFLSLEIDESNYFR